MESFYQSGKRAERGTERFPFHIKFSVAERAKLVKLTKKMKMTGADVIRLLIQQA